MEAAYNWNFGLLLLLLICCLWWWLLLLAICGLSCVVATWSCWLCSLLNLLRWDRGWFLMLGRLYRVPILLRTGNNVMMLWISIRTCSFSEEYLFVSNGLLIALTRIHGAAQLLLSSFLIEVWVMHCLPSKSLSLLVCLTIELGGHCLRRLCLWMLWWMYFTASLGVEVHGLICWSWLSYCHAYRWSLSKYGAVLALSSLVGNDGISSLLMLPLLLNSILLRIILSLLIHF